MLNPKQLRNTWTASIAQSASITIDNRKRKHGHTYLEQGFSGSHPTTTPAAPVVRCASQITQRLALTPRTVPRILPPHRLAPRTLAPPINGVNLKTGTSLDAHHHKQKRVFFVGGMSMEVVKSLSGRIKHHRDVGRKDRPATVCLIAQYDCIWVQRTSVRFDAIIMQTILIGPNHCGINMSLKCTVDKICSCYNCIFIARQHFDTRYWYSNAVCLSVCPSVCLSCRPTIILLK